MITSEQEEWLSHLSDTDKIEIVPFDPTSKEKFEKVKKQIQSKIGNSITVEHMGASSLGISGQDEIDVYVPSPPSEYESLLNSLSEIFGKPRSTYPLKRTRFASRVGGKHIDIFLINSAHQGWLDIKRFEKYLQNHPDSLDAYKILKESGNGLSVREYYRKKIEFINDILEK